jgi:Family of unknown function (DUF6092)
MSVPESDRLFELAAMLVSSARGAPEEGALTASLRLVDAAGRLADLPGASVDDRDRQFLSSLQTTIRQGMTGTYLESEEAYLGFLDRLVEMVADEARQRNGLD